MEGGREKFRSQDMDLSRGIISCIGIENATQQWWPTATAKHAKECHGTPGLDHADRRSVGKAPLEASVENAAGWMEGGSECEGEVTARLRGRARADDAGYTNTLIPSDQNRKRESLIQLI